MSSRPKFSQRFTIFPSGVVVNFTSVEDAKHNVGKRVIRAAGGDGHTWVTYRHPERAQVALWL